MPPKHAGSPSVGDTQIADQARACIEDIKRLAAYDQPFVGETYPNYLQDKVKMQARLLGRALALLEIMAGEKLTPTSAPKRDCPNMTAEPRTARSGMTMTGICGWRPISEHFRNCYGSS